MAESAEAATFGTPVANPGAGLLRYSAAWLFLAMMGGLVGVSLLIPVNKIVASTTGQIKSVNQITVVQSLDPSIIKTLDVTAGQRVAKGQLLATLDETMTIADVEQARAQVEGLTAQVARCEAELARKPFEPGGLPGSYAALQKTLFDKRASEYAASVLSFDEKINQQKATVGKLEADIVSYQAREKIAGQVEGMRNTLFKSGASSLLNLMKATDARLEMQRTMEFDKNALAEANHQVASLEAGRSAYIQKWFNDTDQEVVTARNNLDAANAQLEKAAKHQDLVRLTAAEPSVVLTVDKLSVGSILVQGAEVMTLMPLGAPVEAEVNVPSSDIGFVRVGDTAIVAVDAFRRDEHGYADGHVVWVSPDASTADDNNQPMPAFYRVRIAIGRYHFTGVPENFLLVPGMTLQASIHVGTRSLGGYLLGGALRGAGEALREP